MLVIVGFIIVMGSVFGGFALAGGHLAALYQPLELLIIGGAAVGAFVLGNTSKGAESHGESVAQGNPGPQIYQGHLYGPHGAALQLLAKVRKEGLMSIEADVDSPDESAIFNHYPNILADQEVRGVHDRLPAPDGRRQP